MPPSVAQAGATAGAYGSVSSEMAATPAQAYASDSSVHKEMAPPPQIQPMTDFNTVLQRYRAALLEAKATGNVGKKVEADTLKAWLDASLRTTQSQINTSQSQIQTFVNEYAGSTSDIEKVRKKFKEVRDRGPVLQDVYETDKRNAATPVVSYDPTPIYTKSLLIAGLAAVSFVVARRL